MRAGLAGTAVLKSEDEFFIPQWLSPQHTDFLFSASPRPLYISVLLAAQSSVNHLQQKLLICPHSFSAHCPGSGILSTYSRDMDIVLEVFDTFLFDRFWATVYPAATFRHDKNVVKATTSTFSSMREMPTPIQPATRFFQFAPSQFVHMSEWPRDNIWRQFLTLYMITWYVEYRSCVQC